MGGSEEFGVIHHFGQIHLTSGVNDYESHVIIGRHRAAILKKLGELKIEICFLEGEGRGLHPACDLLPDEYELYLLRTLFPGRKVPARLSDEQAIKLASGDRVTIFRYFYPKLHLYGAEAGEAPNRIEARRGGTEEKRKLILFTRREEAALGNISKVMSKLPPDQRNIGLVYGAGHDFNAANRTPKIIKYTFENILPHRKARAFAAAQSESAQLTIAASPGRIAEDAWTAALTPQAQLQLFPRLKACLDRGDHPAVLRDRLLTGVLDKTGKEEVLRDIETGFALKEGPFADLKMRGGGEYFKQRVKEGELNYISDELHPYTQLELLRAAEHITVPVWKRLVTQIAQLEGLNKLEFKEYAMPLRALDDLLWDCTTEVVENALIEAYNSGGAPFFKFVM